MDFEQAMKRLTEISELMGKSDLKLEDSMKLYTEAVELTKKCKEYIKMRSSRFRPWKLPTDPEVRIWIRKQSGNSSAITRK